MSYFLTSAVCVWLLSVCPSICADDRRREKTSIFIKLHARRIRSCWVLEHSCLFTEPTCTRHTIRYCLTLVPVNVTRYDVTSFPFLCTSHSMEHHSPVSMFYPRTLASTRPPLYTLPSYHGTYLASLFTSFSSLYRRPTSQLALTSSRLFKDR